MRRAINAPNENRLEPVRSSRNCWTLPIFAVLTAHDPPIRLWLDLNPRGGLNCRGKAWDAAPKLTVLNGHCSRGY